MLARDWSKRITWSNIPRIKLGNIWGDTLSNIPQLWNLTSTMMKAFVSNLNQNEWAFNSFPRKATYLNVRKVVLYVHWKVPTRCRNIWNIINRIAYIWSENVFLNIFLWTLSVHRDLLGIDSRRGQIPECIFELKGSYCLYNFSLPLTRKVLANSYLRCIFRG